MLGYQALIVEARMEYEGGGWLGYHHCFRQTAAASPDIPGAKIEPTLWNKAKAADGQWVVIPLITDLGRAGATPGTRAS